MTVADLLAAFERLEPADRARVLAHLGGGFLRLRTDQHPVGIAAGLLELLNGAAVAASVVLFTPGGGAFEAVHLSGGYTDDDDATWRPLLDELRAAAVGVIERRARTIASASKKRAIA